MKLRTDKIIANHNANLRNMNSQTVPITVLPYEPAHVARPPVNDEDIHNAADVVVLEPNQRVIQSKIEQFVYTAAFAVTGEGGGAKVLA